jgi:hypothetical protein
MAVAVTQIVTNSRREIRTVKLLSDRKVKIIFTGLKSIWGSRRVAPLFKL